MIGYPDEAVLRGELSVILKSGRRNVQSGDLNEIGIVFSHGQSIDRSTLLKIYVLSRRLSVHENFEHKTRKELTDILCDAVLEFREALNTPPAPDDRTFAGDFLAKLAKKAKKIHFYFAIRDLDLESRLKLNDVELLPRKDAKKAIDNNFWAKQRFGDAKAFARVSTTGSNGKSQLERARAACEEALGLFRLGMQEHLGRMGGIRQQWLFGLNGAWVSRYGSRWSSGWWNPPEPIELELPDKFDTWRKPIGELSDDLAAVPEPFRGRIRTAVNWLDLATREGYWRLALPLVFSAMEALLVPESIGLKDAVLTVRSMALQTAVEHGFRNPTTTLNAYLGLTAEQSARNVVSCSCH